MYDYGKFDLSMNIIQKLIFTNSMSVFILFDLKYFIHSPIIQHVKASSKLLPNLNLHTEIIGCGVVDKNQIGEATNHSGMKAA